MSRFSTLGLYMWDLHGEMSQGEHLAEDNGQDEDVMSSTDKRTQAGGSGPKYWLETEEMPPTHSL